MEEDVSKLTYPGLLKIDCNMAHSFVPSLKEHATEPARSWPLGVDCSASGTYLVFIIDGMIVAKVGIESFFSSIRCARTLSILALQVVC